MKSRIESTSSGKDGYFRKDFADGSSIDKHGNKTVKDHAGNTRLVAKEDGKEPDFSYQKKYNIETGKDEFGNHQVTLSVLDDAFIENLINETKGLMNNGMIRVNKALPNGESSLETQETEITEEGMKSLNFIVDSYNNYKKGDFSDNITLKSLSNKDIEDFNDDEKKFIDNLSDYMDVDVESLIKNMRAKKLQTVVCRYCDEEMETSANFCENCGAKKECICGNCNSVVNEKSNFCAICGNKLK